MKRWTGNTMTLDHFADFYYLEAISAGMTMAASENPDISWKHSFQKLENDVKEAFSHLTHEMAFRIYVYLYAASLGEARHASGMKITIKETNNSSRETVYRMALDYFPSDNNIKLLKSVFRDNKWPSSFGGKAWLNIVEAMEMYGKISDAAFIDHSVDLEHNGGCVFSKSANMGLYCFGEEMNLKKFLDFKFSHNILETMPKRNDVRVSHKVYRLLERYMNICTIPGTAKYIKTLLAINYLRHDLEWLSDYTVDWAYNEFEVKEMPKATPKAKATPKTTNHVQKIEVGKTYYVKYDGRSHDCGFSSYMTNRGFITISRVHAKYQHGYSDGWWYAKEWLYRTETPNISKTHTRTIEVGKKYYVKYDGNPHGCGFIRSTMVDHDIIVPTDKNLNGYGMYKGFLYHRAWLYEVVEPKENDEEIRAYVKPNAVSIHSDHFSYVSSMTKYLGTTIKVKKCEYGYTIVGTPTTLDWKFDEKWLVFGGKERKVYCANCDEQIRGREFTYDGDVYCESCYNENFADCNGCGDTYHVDNLAASGVDYEMYCESCYNDKFTFCDKCGKDIRKSKKYRTPDHPKYSKLCSVCVENEMTFCDDCQEWKYQCTHTEDGYDACDACLKDCYEKDGEWYYHRENVPGNRRENGNNA